MTTTIPGITTLVRVDMAREALRAYEAAEYMRTVLDQVNAQNKCLNLRMAHLEQELATAQERLQHGSAWLRLRTWIGEALHV
jgi:hypothetical protein